QCRRRTTTYESVDVNTKTVPSPSSSGPPRSIGTAWLYAVAAGITIDAPGEAHGPASGIATSGPASRMHAGTSRGPVGVITTVPPPVVLWAHHPTTKSPEGRVSAPAGPAA